MKPSGNSHRNEDNMRTTWQDPDEEKHNDVVVGENVPPNPDEGKSDAERAAMVSLTLCDWTLGSGNAARANGPTRAFSSRQSPAFPWNSFPQSILLKSCQFLGPKAVVEVR